MMKNDEWGALAYLSKSKYGKNSKIERNTNSSYYTGGESENAYVDNVGQSTTGTVYGVYDMSGGAYEAVAAYVNNGTKYLTSYANSILVNGEKKTKNVYSIGSYDSSGYNYSANSDKYGDAVYETSRYGDQHYQSWNFGNSMFPSTSGPFFNRGGGYHNSAGAGIFSFIGQDASTNSGENYTSFRPVLVVL
ncbi:unknown [Clostridium sp. CAG:273]|nr:unknown [Clostridium sp. CAG:273]